MGLGRGMEGGLNAPPSVEIKKPNDKEGKKNSMKVVFTWWGCLRSVAEVWFCCAVGVEGKERVKGREVYL